MSRVGHLVEIPDGRQEAQEAGKLAIHHLHPETKEAAQPSGGRPKSREETPRRTRARMVNMTSGPYVKPPTGAATERTLSGDQATATVHDTLREPGTEC